MKFPEHSHLPFNFSIIKDGFQPEYKAVDQSSEAGFWIIIANNSIIVQQIGDTFCLPEGILPDTLQPKQNPSSIGRWHGKPLRVFSISGEPPLPPSFVIETLNGIKQRIDMQLLTLAGLGKQILRWERHSRYCSCCGALTEAVHGGQGKRCTACAYEHFPHIHPCIIVLVKRGNKLLLTRKAEWPAGRYGLVAGFLDFGESLEECVIREVREETGIEIEKIRYVTSQSWPFPAQLMAGFVAEYAAGEIVVDQNELEDARWFSADALPDLPSLRSIARLIIDNFK